MIIKNFRDIAIDTISPKEREAFLNKLVSNQVAYAYKNIPFYKKMMQDRKIDPTKINTIKDFRKHIPVLTKTTIRNAGPYALINIEECYKNSKIYLNRSSGGTTGEPTGFFWTEDDWNAVVETMVRGMSDIKIKTRIIAFNGYNQGHIAGPIYDDTVRMLNGLTIPRHFKADDPTALKQMIKFKSNTLIAPPTSGSGKGGSVEDLLNADTQNYINSKNIQMILHSSTPMTDELFDELYSLGIKAIVNSYGSTDALPTAISCLSDPRAMHITNGNVLLEVINDKGEHVASGERGHLIASRIASSSKNGISINQGSQVLRYSVGDDATYIDEGKCKCGKNTPKIKDIKRVANTQDKIEGGCEVW
jgi:phenylacetate-CoA ligase